MLFHSGIFLFFFVAVFSAYWSVKKKTQNILLLTSSYLFYSYWDYRFLILILLSTSIDFVSAIKIEQGKRKWIYFSLLSNFGILGFFKYYNFFIESLNDLSKAVGFNLSLELLNIILPLGISFYTFQTVSYTIDVFKKKNKATHNFLDFAVYVSFFPQLIAGPIERANTLLKQIHSEREFLWENFHKGSWLFFWGVFKKLVIADNLAPYTYWSYIKLGAQSGFDYWVNSIAFSIRFYCDFSGYSDMALGLGLLLGIKLSLNFNLPFFATNPSDFWKRWHITLAKWFSDYVYFPIKAKLRDSVKSRLIAATLTMTLVGLWHGARLNLIIWGLLWGIFIVIYRSIHPYVRRMGMKNKYLGGILSLSGGLLVFFLWVSSGAFFYVETYAHAEHILKMLLFDWNSSDRTVKDLMTVMYYSAPLISMQLIQFYKKDLYFILKWPLIIRALIYTLLIILLLVNGAVGEKEFLYFQF